MPSIYSHSWLGSTAVGAGTVGLGSWNGVVEMEVQNWTGLGHFWLEVWP